MPGQWTVQIVVDGNVLRALPFTITSAGSGGGNGNGLVLSIQNTNGTAGQTLAVPIMLQANRPRPSGLNPGVVYHPTLVKFVFAPPRDQPIAAGGDTPRHSP